MARTTIDHLIINSPYEEPKHYWSYVVHKYQPDFIVRLKTGSLLVLEIKGQDTDQDKTKRKFLDEWVKAVNEHGGFGRWQWAVSKQPGDVVDILDRCAA